MSQPIYRVALARAFKETWKHPGLWFLGFLAMFVGTADAAIIVLRIFDAPSGTFSQKISGALGSALSPLNLLFVDAGTKDLFTLAWYLFLIVAIVVFSVFAIIVGQGALVAAAGNIHEGKSFKLTFAWQRGLEHFWPLLVLNAVKTIAFFALLYAASLPVSSGILSGRPRSLFAAAAIVLVLSLLALIVSFLIFYAICAVVLDKEKIGRAAKLAGRIFSRHWLASLEVAVTLFALDLLLVFAAVIGIYGISLPFYFLSSFFTSVGAPGALIVLVVAFLATYAAFIAWIASIVTTFHVNVWVILYREFRSGALVSKLLRLFYRP